MVQAEPLPPIIAQDESCDEPPIPRPLPSSAGQGKLKDSDSTKATLFTARTATVNSSSASSRSSFTLTDYAGVLQGVPFHARTPEDVVDSLETSLTDGLSEEDAKARLATFGENVFTAEGGPSALSVLIRQMANAMTLILIAVMALSYGVQDFIEGSVIVAIIATNIIVGFVQEYRAEQTMASLRSLASPSATVIRSGETKDIPSKEVVPGDLILINAGSMVPADARLVWANNLEIDEAILTGESLPVAKVLEPLVDPENLLGAGDRINTVFASTNSSKGRGRAVVICTGMQTQMGQIAAALKDQKKEYKTPFHRAYDSTLLWLGLRGGTPLQQKMAQLAYILLCIAVLLAIVVFAVARFNLTNEDVLYAVALGIGVIPESLIAVLTITFALGTRRMAERNVIVRKIDALEALGGVTDIASDKTGTITQGKMVVHEVWTPGSGAFDVETVGHALGLIGKITQRGDEAKEDIKADGFPAGLLDVVHGASLCNIAVIEKSDNGEVQTRGDPTEVALQIFAHKAGLPREALVYTSALLSGDEKTKYDPAKRYTSLAEFNFDSSIKRMTVVYHDNTPTKENRGKPVVLFMKGAVERVLSVCSTCINSSSSIQPLSDEFSKGIMEEVNTLASKGLRVLAFGMRRESTKFGHEDGGITFNMKREDAERDMCFIGLVGIYDPPRLESLPAVRACKKASIRVRMLTGDHPATAAAIAREVEIIMPSDPPSAIMVASDFDRLTDAEVDLLPDLPLVVARCTPETKVRMLEAGKRRGYYMAMTGDGVNDAPALSRAAVGVAMGLGGSDVAKGAADLVLQDDNFGSIVAAIEEGRRTYDNIQRFIVALIVGNVSEVILLMVGLAFRDVAGHSVFPLSPLAILWVNLVTASPPALGLGFEPAGPDVMTRPPHDLGKGVFTWPVIIDTFFYGAVSGVSCLLTFIIIIYGANGGELGTGCNEELAGAMCERAVTNARSSVFLLLTFHLLFICWEMKSLKRSIFNLTLENPWYVDLWRNQVLFWSVIAGFAICPICIYVPVFNTVVFRQTGLGWEWGLVVGMMVLYLASIEFWKLFMHRMGGYEWFGRLGGKKEAADEKQFVSETQMKEKDNAMV